MSMYAGDTAATKYNNQLQEIDNQAAERQAALNARLQEQAMHMAMRQAEMDAARQEREQARADAMAQQDKAQNSALLQADAAARSRNFAAQQPGILAESQGKFGGGLSPTLMSDDIKNPAESAISRGTFGGGLSPTVMGQQKPSALPTAPKKQRTAESEKIPDLVKHAVMGNPRKGETIYNESGDMRVVPGTLAHDKVNRVVTWTDAETGEKVSVPDHIGGMTKEPLTDLEKRAKEADIAYKEGRADKYGEPKGLTLYEQKSLLDDKQRYMKDAAKVKKDLTEAQKNYNNAVSAAKGKVNDPKHKTRIDAAKEALDAQNARLQELSDVIAQLDQFMNQGGAEGGLLGLRPKAKDYGYGKPKFSGESYAIQMESDTATPSELSTTSILPTPSSPRTSLTPADLEARAKAPAMRMAGKLQDALSQIQKQYGLSTVQPKRQLYINKAGTEIRPNPNDPTQYVRAGKPGAPREEVAVDGPTYESMNDYERSQPIDPRYQAQTSAVVPQGMSMQADPIITKDLNNNKIDDEDERAMLAAQDLLRRSKLAQKTRTGTLQAMRDQAKAEAVMAHLQMKYPDIKM